MGLDLFDILAVILGVLFTIRKLDAQRRETTEFPHIARDVFVDWQARETAAYSLGMFACFSKVFAKLAVVYVLYEQMSYRALRLVGMSIDLTWLAIVVVTLYRAHQLSKEKQRLGIVLGGLMVPSDATADSRELKEALTSLRAGEHDKAARQLHEISLHAKEVQKALALYWLGECFVRLGKIAEAKDAFVESLEVDPKLVEPREALKRLEQPRPRAT